MEVVVITEDLVKGRKGGQNHSDRVSIWVLLSKLDALCGTVSQRAHGGTYHPDPYSRLKFAEFIRAPSPIDPRDVLAYLRGAHWQAITPRSWMGHVAAFGGDF